MKKTLEYKKGYVCSYLIDTFEGCEKEKTKLIKEGWICKYVEK